MRPEARVWAAVDLLHRPGHRQDGLRLARQTTDELEAGCVHGELAGQWRLLLAFHAGRAGDTALAQRLLATMISSRPAGQQDAAAAVLRAIGGPHADTRLQIILLEHELARTPAIADEDMLRLHHALAGRPLCARRLPLSPPPRPPGTSPAPPHPRRRPPPHPGRPRRHRELDRRGGDSAGALRLAWELLADQARILGLDDPATLRTRSQVAVWTGRVGDVAGALRQCQELLPDLVRVLGPDHPGTLTIRADVAEWTGVRGCARGASPVSGAAARANPSPGP